MRRSLALVSAAVTSMVALAFLVPLALMVREIARDRALADAERQAASLAPALAISTNRAKIQRAVESTQAGEAGRVAVHLPGRPAIGTSHAHLEDLQSAMVRGRSFSADAPGGYVLLQPVAMDQGRTTVVEVYLPKEDLTRGVQSAWIVLTGVAAALVLGSVVVADRLAARVVGSARTLAKAATVLGAGDLRTRIYPEGPPELQEAGRAFNTMADRVEALLAAERELIADLSHRLRTPLTAMRLNAAALGEEPAAEQTRLAVRRLEDEVDQIIGAARKPKQRAFCDAAEVLRDRMEFWSALAEDQARECTLVGAEQPVAVPIVRGELSAVLDSLLGNVFRHTPEGTAFMVTLYEGVGRVAILVADAGPGITDSDEALRRGASGGGSTGLGLDIARRMAKAVGGDVRIDQSTLGGAQIQIWLPVAGARRL
ncbi:HAMP domain-containing sensor histidine kinase [Actinomadura sp. DC4]|uniref:sensor histidine kinase n=1 Tax=Actinomadura sp. DC4 TaxID=3055069 RepID=UPI0025B14F3A|nr:HAMP domain-containing sensor histidine kinase [Actinomadura sp. DC4]MDN3359200.1 HAMP domain-containing sensor histidine kinase [Actinomadura sp. DC4]